MAAVTAPVPRGVGKAQIAMMYEGFNARKTCRVTGCTPSQLRYWDTVGLLKPSIQGTDGRAGRRRVYSFEDLVVLRGVRGLKDGGLSIQRIRRAWKYLRTQGVFADGPLVTEGLAAVKAAANNGSLVSALRSGQMVFLEMLEGAVNEVAPDPTLFELDRERFLRYVSETRSVCAARLPVAATG